MRPIEDQSNNLHEDVLMPDKDFHVRAFYYEQNELQGLFNVHWHENFEAIHVISGKMTIECDGETIIANPSDTVIINSNELHSCPQIETPLKLYCVIFDMKILNSRYFDKTENQYIQPILNNNLSFQRLIRNNTVLNEKIINICNEIQEQEIGYELATKANLLDIIVLLLRRYILKIITPLEKSIKTKNNSRIDEIIKHIDENYQDDISIEELANSIYVSKSYLCKLFKKMLGKTVTEYINYIRITAAERLLQSGDMNITDIALAVGYNDINYFCRMFKRHTGVTPTQMRSEKEL
ncbi:MAG: AraC family transcriptional regulator [Oscillospiraceae bacterium]